MSASYDNSSSHQYHRSADAPELGSVWCASVWFRPDADDEIYTLFFIQHDDADNNVWALTANGLLAGDLVRWRSYREDTHHYVDSSNGFTTGQWCHAFVVWDTDTLKISVDGEAFQTQGSAKRPNGEETYVQVSGHAATWPGMSGARRTRSPSPRCRDPTGPRSRSCPSAT